MIVREEILKNYTTGEIQILPNDTLKYNLSFLLERINEFRLDYYKKPMIVVSGYRSLEYNMKIGGAKSSLHAQCLAVDIRDLDGSLDQYCIDNQHILQHCGLYIEHPYYTKGWTHFQVEPPLSQKLIFIPYGHQPSEKHQDEQFKFI
jgi:hypothetical protein